MSTLLTAVCSILLSVAAQFSLKAGMSSEAVRDALVQPHALRTAVAVFSNGYVLGGFLLYGMGAIVWLGVLSQWDVSKAYPLVGLGFVFTVFIGFMLNEQISLLRLAGVGFICTGVFLVGKS